MNTPPNDISDFILQKESAARHQPRGGQFFQILPDGRYAFWLDNSSLSTYTQCQEMFHLKSVRFAPMTLRRKGPTGAAMNIGSWWSKVSEEFYKHIAASQEGRVTGEDAHTVEMPTLQDMMLIAARAWVSCGMDDLQRSQPDKYDKFAIPVPTGQIGKYFPQTSFDELFVGLYHDQAKKLRAQAVRQVQLGGEAETIHEQEMCCEEAAYLNSKAIELESRSSLALGPILMAAEYYNMFAAQDIRDWRVIGAELAFGRHGEVCLNPNDHNDNVVVYWQGKPDLTIWEEKTGTLAPLDQKTKDYIKNGVQDAWKPHAQTAGYIFSIGQIARDLGFDGVTVDRCIISVCGRMRPAEPRKKGDLPKPRFVRVRPHYAKEEIEEWRLNTIRLAENLRASLEKDQWVRDDGRVCTPFAGNPCEYRGICSRPDGVRPLIIQSDYEMKEPWSPFDEDGD